MVTYISSISIAKNIFKDITIRLPSFWNHRLTMFNYNFNLQSKSIRSMKRCTHIHSFSLMFRYTTCANNIQKIKKRDTRDKKQKGAYVDRTRGCLADPTSFVVTLTNFTLNYYHRLSTGPCRIAASFAADVVKISMRCPSEWRFSAQPPWNSDHTIPNERPSLLPSFRFSILLRLDRQDLGTIRGRTVWITKQDSRIRQFG